MNKRYDQIDLDEVEMAHSEDVAPELRGTLPADNAGVDVATLHDFYSIERKDGKDKIVLDKLRIIRILRRMGYLRYDTPNGDINYVYIHNNKMRLTDKTQIIDAFEDYINSLPNYNMQIMRNGNNVNEPTTEDKIITKNMILSTFYASDMNKYFTILDRLRPERPIELMTDNKTTKYYFFNNTCVAVGASGWRLLPYDSPEIKGCVWESSVIDRDFEYTDRVGDYEVFCRHICGDKADEGLVRFRCLMSILGYLTHDFYETDLKAVFFTDVNKEQAGKAAGRTGKGLLGKACNYVLNRKKTDTKYVEIPGKGFDHNQGNGTCYSLADISTQLIHIQDIDVKHFSFEDLYNDITDGTKIRKNYDRYPIIKFVKFMLSSNQTINLFGSSSLGRVCIFELSNYYSNVRRPQDEFKRRFFESEWTDKDWNEFFSFMIRCSQEYFANGLQEPAAIHYTERRVIEKLGQEIRDFIKEILAQYPGAKAMERTQISKPQLLQKYHDTRDSSFTDQKRVTAWFKLYFDIMGIPYVEKRSTTDVFVLYPSRDDFI